MPEKQYRSWDLDQAYLLPPSLRDWLPEDHLVYRLLEVVESLDISEILDEVQSKDARGTRPYHPRMMLALLVYSYCVGVYSSRKMAEATHERVPFRVLTGDRHPHFTVINDFRSRHRKALDGLFVQLLRLCQRMGLVNLGHVSLDGTKMAANASKHKAMSYARMKKEIGRLEEEVAELFARAEAADAAEDEEYGEGREADEVPAELKRREDRLKRIRQAKAELEEEARAARVEDLRRQAEEQREKAKKTSDPVEKKRKETRAKKADLEANRLVRKSDDGRDDSGGAGGGGAEDLPRHRVPRTPEGKPTEKAQRNFTDPDSRIMKRDGAFLQAFNCQTVVDDEHQVVVAQAVTNQAPDQQHLVPLMEQARKNLEQVPDCLSADSGYYADANVAYCEDIGVDAYIAVQRDKHGELKETGSSRETGCTSETRNRMTAKLKTDAGRAIYKQRKAIVEPVYGQIKTCRGFQRFSFRGLEKNRYEWTLVTLCHNLLKLIGALPTAGLKATKMLQHANATP